MTTLAPIQAFLHYGSRKVDIDLKGIPPFDFSNIDGTAEQAMGYMSHRSGGFEMNEARVQINKDRTYAKVWGNGFTIVWGTLPGKFPSGIPFEELERLIEERVASYQSGNIEFGVRAVGGHPKRTTWKPSEFAHAEINNLDKDNL